MYRKHVLPDPTPIIYARREFYDFDAWDNASSMKQKIERTYVKLAKECSKKVPWTYWEKRNSDHVYYLALEVKNGQ